MKSLSVRDLKSISELEKLWYEKRDTSEKMTDEGPSSLIGCPDGCILDNLLIIKYPNISEKNNPVIIDAPVLNVI